MERRSFLGGLTAASFGALLDYSFVKAGRSPNGK